MFSLNNNYFRMSYDDWIKNFDNCQISNLTPVKKIETNVINQPDLRFLSVNIY